MKGWLSYRFEKLLPLNFLLWKVRVEGDEFFLSIAFPRTFLNFRTKENSITKWNHFLSSQAKVGSASGSLMSGGVEVVVGRHG